MRRSIFWLLLALIALSVVVNIAVADGSDDGSDDEADTPPAAGGQAAEEGGDVQVEEDEDDEEEDDDDDEANLPPGTPRVHSKVSVVATISLKDNTMHKELAHKVSYSFSNKASDIFNISVVWGRLYNAQKTHIIQNFTGIEVGHELKPDEEHTVEYTFVPHRQLEAGAEYFVELLGYFTPLVNTQNKHYVHTAFNATVKLQEKPGKFTGPFLFSVSLVCIIFGGLYMIKSNANKQVIASKFTSKASSAKDSEDGFGGFLGKSHSNLAPKKKSSNK